MTSVYMLII